MNPEFRESLEAELQEKYDQLADISERQRQLNRERDRVEGDRNVILVELGRMGIRGYDVT